MPTCLHCHKEIERTKRMYIHKNNADYRACGHDALPASDCGGLAETAAELAELYMHVAQVIR